MRKGKSKKKDKKKIDIDKLLTIVIITVLSVLLSFSYCHKKEMLEDTKTTTCIVVGINDEPGTRWGYQINVCYYVNEKEHYHRASVSSIKCKIGDKFRIKYSIKRPNNLRSIMGRTGLGRRTQGRQFRMSIYIVNKTR